MLHIICRMYRIARNVDGGKHWRIQLKTTLAKKYWRMHSSQVMKQCWQKCWQLPIRL